jgi:hypothetical protein
MKHQNIFKPFIILAALLIFPMLDWSTGDLLVSAGTHKIQAEAYGQKLGTVRFPVSCNEEAKPQVERGLALLHHMTYHGARSAFVTATQRDPGCAMGYWGQAMTYIHPFWSDAPSKKDFAVGQTLIYKAQNQANTTDREKAYIEAAAAHIHLIVWANEKGKGASIKGFVNRKNTSP